ncbi:MAG TPA: response regulator transcription factor [Candidatus Saccharimonadales bacterium]|nr:response regulator transcription factor [Candidatus Saccharimonadales bacterium]
MPRILIVEDEVHLAQGLLFNLEVEGHEVSAVETGEAALETLLDRGEHFDAVVLDIMLPGVNGFDVADRLRAAQNYVPILMLTARSRPEDVLKGFAAGADDYLPKPFELNILIARVHGLLRRTQWQREVSARERKPGAAVAESDGVEAGPGRKIEGPPTPVAHDVFSFDGRAFDFNTLELTAPAGRIQLTLMEASLLRYFIDHRNENVSRKQILEEVWGLHEDTDTRAIDNFIVRLRRYLEDSPASPKYLITVRGIGYRFLPE